MGNYYFEVCAGVNYLTLLGLEIDAVPDLCPNVFVPGKKVFNVCSDCIRYCGLMPWG